MKKYYWLIILLFGIIVSTNSCKKDSSNNINEPDITNQDLPSIPFIIAPETSKTGNVIIRWKRAKKAQSYTLQENQIPNFDSTKTIYNGIDTVIRLADRQFNTAYYYRLKANNEKGSSNWSVTKGIIFIQLPAPNLSLISPNIDFGDVLSGKIKTLPLVILNNGNALLKIENILGDNASFTIGRTLPFYILAGAYDTTSIRFSPMVDTVHSGKILINSDDPDDFPSLVVLEGIGIRKAILSINSTMINFGQVDVNSENIKNITAYNLGNAILAISNVTISDTNYSLSTRLPFNILPEVILPRFSGQQVKTKN